MERRNFLASAAFKAIIMSVALGLSVVASTSAVAALTPAQQSAADALAIRIQQAVEESVTSTLASPGGASGGVLEVLVKRALDAAMRENPDPLIQNMALATAVANMKNSPVLTSIPSGDGTSPGGLDRLSGAIQDAQHAVILHAIEKVVADAGPHASEKEIKALIAEQITICGADTVGVGPALRILAENDNNPVAKSAAISLSHTYHADIGPAGEPLYILPGSSGPTGSNTGGVVQSQPGGQEATTTTYVS